MKASPFLALLLALAPVSAQEAKPDEEPQRKVSPAEEQFRNLPQERRQEFGKHLQRASELFRQKRIFETLDELAKAEAIFPDSPDLLNLKGSCYVELRSFDKALEAFNRALEIAPDSQSIEFNIAEVHFVTKDWEKAHELFEKLSAEIPDDNLALGRLVEFKLLLCKKKLGRAEEAAALADKYDFFDDSPFHYYAKAALAYDDGELVKAEEWLARASRVFQNPAILAPWQDTLVEFGYIKSFYGQDESAE